MIREFMSELKSLGPSFVMTIGLPGSGKDTYYTTYLEGYYTMISSDLIREEVFGDINDQTHNTEVFEIMFKRASEALKNGKNVYYNATNLSSRRRASLLKRLRQNVKSNFQAEAWIFVPSFEICCERNSNRERTVPQFAMERMYKNFEPPYYHEGWDYIVKKSTPESFNYINILMEKAMGIPHDNPHHSLTIGAHMELTNILFRSKYVHELMNPWERNDCNRHIITSEDYNIMYCATKYHDLGKVFCKTFINSKGETTSIAHYYNHSNVGAYIYLTTADPSDIKGFKDELLIANLIADHMKFFNGEKAIEKLREKYGENFWMLEELHEFDISAH